MEFLRVLCVLFWFSHSCVNSFGDTLNNNLIEGPGFEKWNKEKNMPTGASWRWNMDRGVKRNKKFSFNQAKDEKHSGENSLKIHDSSNAKVNDVIFWQLSKIEVKNLRGKTLRFSAWIKQVFSSSPNSVGIGIWGQTKDGKHFKGKKTIQTTGETEWGQYSVMLKIPSNTTTLRAYFYCARGWGRLAEAYFDDLELIEASDSQESCSQSSSSFNQNKNGSRFYFFKDNFMPLWKKTNWGGFYMEKARSSAFLGTEGLRVKTAQGTRNFAGFAIVCNFINKLPDLSGFSRKNSYLEFFIRSKIPVNVSIAQSKFLKIKNEYVVPVKDNWKRVRIPLSAFSSKNSLKGLNKISFQIGKAMPKGNKIEIDEICLFSLSPVKTPEYATVPQRLDEFKKLMPPKEKVFCKDRFARPTINNGIFFTNEKPVFFVGPWFTSGSLITGWNKKSKRNALKGRIYDTPFDKEIADILGMNSMQLSAASYVPAIINFNAPLLDKDLKIGYKMIPFLKNLKGMPFVLDFAWVGAIPKRLKKEGRFPRVAKQQNSDWHHFIPMCPEHPLGDSVYSEYFKTGTQFTLEHGGNPFVYELFNESSYNCRCKFNRNMFKVFLEKVFGTVPKANHVMGTSFKSFKEAACVPRYEKFPGLWCEWCKFSGICYAELLKKYKALIKKIDKRKNIYFTEQIGLSCILKYRGGSMDYRRIADSLDVLGVEGGRGFGRKLKIQHSDGNAMEDALSKRGETYSFILDMFTTLSKNKKPILNLEHYCGRFLFGKRAPTRKEDIVTALWNEVFHGVSGSYFYAWHKRVWEWKTYEDAKKMVINGGYKAYNLLTPYAYPRKALDGFKIFSEEIKKFAEIALPMPRLKKAKVAFVYSYPTLRMATISKLDVEKRIAYYYSALLYSHYPMDILMEEDIPSVNLSSYDAIVFPFITNSYKETLPTIKKYVKNGGIVICSPGAFSENEHGKPFVVEKSFLGVKSINVPKKIDRFIVAGGTYPIAFNRIVSPTRAALVFASNDGTPVLTERAMGKGKVYCVTGETSQLGTRTLLSYILKKCKVGKYANIFPVAGKTLGKVEFQIIDRGDKKLIYIVNWDDKGSKLLKLSLNLASVQNSYFCAPFAGFQFTTPDGGDRWNSKLLKDGILLIVPPQQRVILFISKEKPEGITKAKDSTQIRKEFEKVTEKERPLLDALARKERVLLNLYSDTRIYKDLNQSKCFPVDLTKNVNMAFKDDIDGDQKGGWFDQGGNDFRYMPLGRQIFANVPFEIIDPENNNGKSAIVLYGPARPYFPKKVTGIPINKKVKNIYFLHGAGWGVREGKLCHTYLIKYADGTNIEIPVIFGESISSWWRPKAVPNAKIACESSNLMSGHIGLYCFKWENKHPEKEIESFDAVASKDKVVPALVAVTVERF